MATSSTYCTHRDLKDVYPNLDEFDTKTPIYDWTTTTLESSTYYLANNTGLMTQLFINGVSQQSGNQTIGTTAATLVNGTYTSSATLFVVDDGDQLTDHSYIKIEDEILGITAISTDTLTLVRGQLGTTAAAHPDNSPIYQHFDPNLNGDNLYDSDNDFIIFKYGSNPNDLLAETGEDFSTLITRIMKNSSRYVDSRIDAGIPRDAFKDKEGNYDYFLVRTTSLVSIYFLMNAHIPGTEVAEKFLEEANFNIDQINTGKTKLSYQVTGDSASGVLREVVAPQAANALYIVDTRGHYTGIYDLMKIVISTAGAIGTAKYDVYHGDSTGLKQNKVVDAELITGKYQSVGGGLQIRFAGSTDASVATLGATPDEWELECWGQYESLDDSPGSGTNTRLTRRAY